MTHSLDRPTRAFTMTRRSILLALLLLGSAQGLLADPEQLLRRSDTADTRVSYAGKKVIRRCTGGDQDAAQRTVRVMHLAPDKTRIEFVSGRPAGSAIIQDGDRRYLVGRTGEARRTPHTRSPGRTDLLLQNYRVRFLRSEKIAGHKALVLAIDPRHEGNPRKVVWLEPRTGLILKTQLFNSAGELSEESAFQEIDFNPSFPPNLFDVAAAQELPTPEPVKLDFTPRRPRYIPPGHLLVQTITFVDRNRRVVHYLRYTDGLNTLSLFESRSALADGARHFGVRLTGVAGDVHFSLVGDLSQDELRKMADSIAR